MAHIDVLQSEMNSIKIMLNQLESNQKTCERDANEMGKQIEKLRTKQETTDRVLQTMAENVETLMPIKTIMERMEQSVTKLNEAVTIFNIDITTLKTQMLSSNDTQKGWKNYASQIVIGVLLMFIGFLLNK